MLPVNIDNMGAVYEKDQCDYRSDANTSSLYS
jgi:hypothetical protein